MADNAWVTLATNDSYALGAQVLAHSLKKVNTKYKLAVLVTPGVSDCMKERLAQVFDLVHLVDVLDSKDAANLALLERPELGVTFTKLHCWKLVQFKKCVFLDADTLIIQNSDDLFEREEFSAAPDVGWPDCFNSGVFVFKPSVETYDALIKFAKERGSFDGGDQGLLNTFFENWSLQDSSKRLPFVYNLCSVACYSYLPAFKKFGQNVRIFHFIGNSKPWLQHFDPVSCQVETPAGDPHLGVFLQFWWNIFFDKVHSTLNANMGGLAAAFAQITLGVAQTQAQVAFEEKLRKEAWEAGHIDYLGRDSFDNILSKISETLSLGLPVKPSTPEVPKEDSKKGSETTNINVKVEGEVTTTSTTSTPEIKNDVADQAKISEVKEVVCSNDQSSKPVTETTEAKAKEDAVPNAPEAVPKSPEVVTNAPEVVTNAPEVVPKAPGAPEALPKAPEAVPKAPAATEALPKAPEAVPKAETVPSPALLQSGEKDKAAETPKDSSQVGPAVLVEKQPEVGPAVLVKKDKNEKEKAPELGPGVVSTVAICPNLTVAEVYKPTPAEQLKDQVTTSQKGPAEADPAAACKQEANKDPSKPVTSACTLPQVPNAAQPANEQLQEIKAAVVAETLVKEFTEKSGEKVEPVASEPVKQECVKDQTEPLSKLNEVANQVSPTIEPSEQECVKETVAALKTDDAAKHTHATELSKTDDLLNQSIPKTPGIIEATPPSSPLSAIGTLPEVPAAKTETPDSSCDGKNAEVIALACEKQQTNAAQPTPDREVKDVAPQCPLASVQNLKIESTTPQTPPVCVEKKQVFEVKAGIKSDDKSTVTQDKSVAPVAADQETGIPTDPCKKDVVETSETAPILPESQKQDLKETPKSENAEAEAQQPKLDSENKTAIIDAAKAEVSGKTDNKATSQDQKTSKQIGEDNNANTTESKDVKQEGPEQSGKPSEADKNISKTAESKDVKDPACAAKPAAGGAKKKPTALTKGKSEQSEKKEASGESGPVPPPRKKDPKKTTPNPKPAKPSKK